MVYLHKEQTITTPLDRQTFVSTMNLISESPELKEPYIRPNSGITVKQITALTVGTISCLAVMTVEQ